MLRNHKSGHADVNIMLHMLEHFSFLCLVIAVSALHVDIVVASHCCLHIVCGFCLLLFLLFHTVVASHYVVCFVHIVCVYSIEKGFGSYICTCNMRTYTSILCAHTRAHLQPFEIKIVQHLINPP